MTSSAVDSTWPGLDLRPMRPLVYRSTPARPSAAVTVGPIEAWDDHHVRDLMERRSDHVLHLVAPDGRAERSPSPGSTARAWLADTVVTRTPVSTLFAWTWEGAGHVVRGVAGAVSLPLAGATVPHERVRAAVVDLRRRQLVQAAVQVEPIMLLHDGAALFGPRLLDQGDRVEPVFEVRGRGQRHRVWPVGGPGAERAVRQRLASAAAPVVADGHHRLAALDGLVGRGWSEAMVLVIDTATSDLTMGSVHRVVPGVDLDQVGATSGAQLTAIGAGTEADWLAAVPAGHLRWVLGDAAVLAGLDLTVEATRAARPTAPSCGSPVALDTCHLHSHLLPAWQVDEQDVGYVHDWPRAKRLASARHGLAVRTAAPALSDVVDVARGGHLLPHKATSIGPKPRIGMLMLPAFSA
ncbi:DUF1015 domain-containing protein [soil metagenome]